MAAVIADESDDLIFARNNFHRCAFVKRIQDHIRIARRVKGETETRATFRGRDFGLRLPRVEIDAVVAGLRDFLGVRKIGRAVVVVHYQFAADRHQREHRVVADPRTRLMRLPDAANLVVRILVEKRFALRLGVRRPGIHWERQRDGGILIAVREVARGIGAHQRVGQRDQRPVFQDIGGLPHRHLAAQ